jgi:hypothetical protein
MGSSIWTEIEVAGETATEIGFDHLSHNIGV